MLNRHPRVAIPLESLFIVDYLRAESRFNLDRLKSLLVNEPEVKEWGLHVTMGDFGDCPSIASCIARLHERYAEGSGADIWGQKTPRFVRHLDLILEHFPDARFIHVIRDPRAVANSLIQSDVHRSDAYHAALRWEEDVRRGLAFEGGHPDITLRTHYESLVTHPDDEMEKILRFLKLDPARVHQRSSPQKGLGEYSEFYANIHANLDRMPTPEFVDKWKTSLSKTDLEVVEALCRDQMDTLDYALQLETPMVGAMVIPRMKVKRVYLALLQTFRYLRYRPSYFFYLFWRKWRLGLLREFLWTVNY
jgi:hypothetical protein